MTGVESKHISDSQVTLAQFMQPEHANNLGNVHGGVIMKLIDEAGGLCATRHARCPAVTVAVDSLRFLSPVRAGKRVRGRFVLAEATLRKPTELLSRTNVTVEIEGEDKPALVADWLGLIYFA